MPNLYVTNVAAVDYGPLERKYGGEVISMTQGYVDLTTPQGVEDLYKRIYKKLKTSSPEDYVVLSGAAVITAMIVHFWLKYHKIAHILTYNKKFDSYQEIILTDTDLIPDEAPNTSNNS